MSIIGRLDDQVDAVLIAPLDRERRRKTATREAEADEQPALSQRIPKTPDEADDSRNESAAREDLPVWLL